MDPVNGDDSLTIKVLESIRDEIRELRSDTNQRFQSLSGDVNQLRSDTNERLDFLAEGQVRLRTEVTDLKGEVIDLKGQVIRNGERFEHFLFTQGDTVRDLHERIARVESHLRLPPLKP